MTDDSYLLGIDVGTTGSKVVLIDDQGRVVAAATHEYPLLTPKPNWCEQDPDDWWTATVAGIRAVLDPSTLPASPTTARTRPARNTAHQRRSTPADLVRGTHPAVDETPRPIDTAPRAVAPGGVAAIGITGQMHGATLLDGGGRVLRPAILWNDQRTGDQCAEITRRVGGDRVVQLNGSSVLPGFTAPKVLWVQQHEPEVYSRIESLLLPKDYVRYRLTGERCSDVSDASGTALFDVADRRWCDEMLEAAGVSRGWLPEVSESVEVSSGVSPEAAGETGLVAGVPVVGGAGDQAAQAVGTGIVEEGVVSVTLGTSGVVFAASDCYRVEPQGKLHAFCHAVPGMWHLMGVMLSAGGSLRWYRDTLGQGECIRARTEGRDPYDLLIESAAEVEAGCEGLLFLPYLTGERTPHADPDARGVFFGLSPRHTKAHLTRAVLEGVAYGLRDSLELIGSMGLHIGQLRASGGGARSAVWLQILADVFARPIATVKVTEGAAYGAALLAGVGAGVFPSVAEATRATVQVAQQTHPGPQADVYARNYPRYRSLYSALAGEFGKLVR